MLLARLIELQQELKHKNKQLDPLSIQLLQEKINLIQLRLEQNNSKNNFDNENQAAPVLIDASQNTNTITLGGEHDTHMHLSPPQKIPTLKTEERNNNTNLSPLSANHKDQSTTSDQMLHLAPPQKHTILFSKTPVESKEKKVPKDLDN